MKTTVTLIRHGETEWNRLGKIQGTSDIPLNNTGKTQAEEKAELLPNNYTLAITSPLQRAQETLNIILNKLHLHIPIITSSSFIERDFGIYDGGNGCDFRKKFDPTTIDTSYEQDKDLEKRVMSGLLNLVKKYKNDTILITAHSHVLKAALISIDPNQFNYFPTVLNNLGTIVLEYQHTIGKWLIITHETSAN